MTCGYRRLAALAFTALFSFGLIASAAARPAKVIILRHGEKQDDFALCQTGIDRSLALAAQYLGQGAKQSLFSGNDRPAAFFAITLHTLELISPAAATWRMPVVTFSSVPLPNVDLKPQLNLRTQQAVNALMNDKQYDGKTVVMAWEHHRIADNKLELEFPDERVTLRQLLNLDKLKNVPDTWPGHTYDYFWIVEFGKKSDIPTRFTATKQVFSAPFASVPSNDWDAKERLPTDSKCLH